ncbi:hypothetical protein EYF80_050120 [Liparis tanakae]|uniref:Uncharacterized protein n=1 Tax=Liparis tanakae TaxID=230148 RepID=A0A4Z2FG40_9TELE|nr:hypothetical protein EYF80_050120 [Liparis tanakae]
MNGCGTVERWPCAPRGEADTGVGKEEARRTLALLHEEAEPGEAGSGQMDGLSQCRGGDSWLAWPPRAKALDPVL